MSTTWNSNYLYILNLTKCNLEDMHITEKKTILKYS